MNTQNKKQKLSSYLRPAAQEKSTLGREEVANLLSRPIPKPFWESITFKITIMTTAAIIISVFLFLNTGEEVEQQSKIEIQEEVQIPMKKPTKDNELVLAADTPKVKVGNAPVDRLKSIDSIESASEFHGEDDRLNLKLEGPIELNIESIRRIDDRTGLVVADELVENTKQDEKKGESSVATDDKSEENLVDRGKITTVELNEDILKKLNISVENRVVVYRFRNMVMHLDKPHTQVKINKSKEMAGYLLPDKLVPVFITDALGTASRFSSIPDEEIKNIVNELGIDSTALWKSSGNWNRVQREFMSRHVNTLIPVLVKSGRKYTLLDRTIKNWSPDAIFWFFPSDSLFSLLPQEVAGEIETEVKEIKGTSIKQTSSCKYFEVCRSNSASVEELKMYPNPTEGQFTLEIKANKAAKAQVGLYDLGGKAIMNLDENKPLAEGITSSVYDISSLPAGIYLLIIQSGEGQFNYQRVVKM